MAYAFTGSGSNAADASGVSLSVAATVADGEMLLVWVTYGKGTLITASVSDGVNEFTQIGSTIHNTSNQQSCALFQCTSAVGGTRDITFTLASSALYRAVGYLRYTGLSGTAQATVGQSQLTPGTGTDGVSSGSITPVSQPAALIGITFAPISGAATLTAGTGFTDRGDFAATLAAFNNTSRIEDKLLTGTAATAATFTSSVNDAVITMAAVISVAAAGDYAPVITDVSADPVTDNTADINWTSTDAGPSVIEVGKTTSYELPSESLDAAAVISNVVVTVNSPTSVTIAWDLSEFATGQVEYGPTNAYGQLSTKENSFNYNHHQQTLNNLTANAVYHFRLVSTDQSGSTSYSNDLLFSTDSAIPLISNIVVTVDSPSSVIIEWDTDKVATAQVEYGLTNAYGQLSAKEDSLTLTHHARTLTGLSGGVYHFRLASAGQSGVTAYSADLTFTTDSSAPVISNIAVTVNSSTSATISWSLNKPATGQVEYGTTASYGLLSTKESSFNYSSHARTLTGLTPGAIYHFRAVSTDATNLTSVSSDLTFSTDTAFPVISNNSVAVLTPNSVKVIWDLSEFATGQVEYGTTTSYGQLSKKEASFNYNHHEQTLSNLTPGVIYHYRLISTDQAGNTTTSTDFTFTTNSYTQIAWIAAGQFVSAVGDITVNFPSGYQNDDMAILLVETANQAISTPAGWTLHAEGVTSQGTAGAAGGIRLTMFYKFCSGIQGPVVITDATDHKSAIIHIVRGVSKTNPIELINNSTYIQAAPGTSFYFFPITTSGPDRLILFCAAAQYDIDSTAYFGWEAALTERSDNMSSAGIGGGIGVATMPQATAGDAGDRRGYLVNNSNVALLGIVLIQADANTLVSGGADSVASQSLDAPDIGIMLGGNTASEAGTSASVNITVAADNGSGGATPAKSRSYSITINVSDINSQAARAFYREIRMFAERTKPWQTAIFYETKPDERWDLTLVSLRVYGRRDEYLTIMAAAGIDVFEQELKQKQLVLPTESQLAAIKRKYGFESLSNLREDFKPVWIE
jgi:hypothetical protein